MYGKRVPCMPYMYVNADFKITTEIAPERGLLLFGQIEANSSHEAIEYICNNSFENSLLYSEYYFQFFRHALIFWASNGKAH